METRVLAVAALESTGRSGLLADLRTLWRLGVPGAGIATALGVEGPAGFGVLHELPATALREALREALADGRTRAVKVGFVTTVPVIRLLARDIAAARLPAVVDQPIATRAGAPLLRSTSANAFVRDLLPHAALVTPNLPEASLLAGFPIRGEDDAKRAARAIQGLGPRAVLIKGGHAEGDVVVDGLLDGRTWSTFRHPRLPLGRPDGAGGLVSAAVAAYLARGETLPDAVAAALDFVHRELAESCAAGTSR
jgi:hydroxymethylpyrimidine kinase/phosphomethylpyrimidine kinase